MSQLLQSLGTLLDLLLVVLGFSFIIVVHELGHFWAARWAGVRVLGFAVGFGPALVSWRKGIGFRRGSSEQEYLKRMGVKTHDQITAASAADSPFCSYEYRLNALPLGGYVKMLAQEDADPSATSDEPDAFVKAPVWKRMIIISAGVVMNLILAAVLFVVVFMIGLRTEPAKVGVVSPGSPAAVAKVLNADQSGVTEPGLLPGDRVLSINGDRQSTFNDVMLAVAMARGDTPMTFVVDRPGVGEVKLEVTPRVDPSTRLLMIGVGPSSSPTLVTSKSSAARDALQVQLDFRGFANVAPGMTVTGVEVDGVARSVGSFADAQAAAMESAGRPMKVGFESRAADGGAGTRVDVETRAIPGMQTARFVGPQGSFIDEEHLLGLMGVLTVTRASDEGRAKGIRDGDTLAQVGSVTWPSRIEAISTIRSRSGGTVRVVVARPGEAAGDWSMVDLGEVAVSSKGTIGFGFAELARTPARVARWPSLASATASHDKGKAGEGATETTLSGAALGVLPGSRILAINDRAISTFGDLRDAVHDACRDAMGGDVALRMKVELPISMVGESAVALSARPTEEVTWRISQIEAAKVLVLGWEFPIDAALFELEQFDDRAGDPIAAVSKGLRETHRVMMSTYLTLARLVQGTVKIEHMRGPVGIAHAGTLLVERGVVWLLFFMALISVNLAVVNFLPMPIADGGHFVFLVYEQLTGKPPPPVVINIAALVGIVVLGGIFLIVTINDIQRLFG
jgi:regulator of sigma E protease